MKHKLFLPIFSTLFLFVLVSGSVAIAASGSCPTDGGASSGVVCSDSTYKYYCLSACRSTATAPQCPSWSGLPCSDGTSGGCIAHCASADACGFCASCEAGYELIGSYLTNPITKQCRPFGTVLKLGTDSIGPNNFILQSAGNAFNLLSTGEIGIGTEEPSNELHIYNEVSGPIINLQGKETNYRGLRIATSITDNSEKWFVGVNDENKQQFVIRTNDIDALMINPNNQTITASSLAGSGTVCLQANNDGLISKYGGPCGGTGGSLTGGTTNYIPIWNSASTMGTSTIYQGLNGNVVIGGTTSSSYKLYVAGSQYVSGSVVANVDGVFLGGDIYDTTDNLMISAEDNLYLNMDYNGNDDNTRSIVFSKNAGINSTPTSDNELMRITESGRVGVGTTNPQNELHIYNSSSGPIVNLEGDFSSQYQGIRIGDKDNSNMEKWFMGSNNTGGNYVIRRKSSAGVSTNDLFIDYATGNITLATTTVSGSLNIRPLCDGTSNALRTDSSGNVICGTITATGGTGGNVASGTISGQTLMWNGSSWLANSNLFNNGTVIGLGSKATVTISTGNIATAGTITSGLINGQTISSSANLTGTLAVSKALTIDTNTFVVNDSNDTIGMGTTNSDPLINVQIHDAVNGPVIRLQNTNLSNTYKGISIYDSASTNEKWFMGSNNSTDFVVRRGGTTDDLKIDTNGKIIVNSLIGNGDRCLYANASGQITATTTACNTGGGVVREEHYQLV